ncbi:tyrosine-protein kinase receptor [Nesidiocoris tenuis]|uniref:Tyrosine-protein kinase receptor n=1 Tax=Nesidiocoris tenuis TaxID=355587 RepID=A0ABN7B2Y0_9HEMI|nr:tyrosine-protein kinase receptor [Nesidiocoris tenuis]
MSSIVVAWVEDIGEEHSSVILPHYELDEYEDTGNWSEDLGEISGNASGVLRWVRELGNLSREEGESVRLRCEAEGEPGPITIKWLRNEAPIDSGLGPVGKRRLSFRTTQSAHKANSRLRIGRLEVHDSGFYTCKARNGGGRTISTTGLLKIRMTPFGHDVSNIRTNFPLFPPHIDSANLPKDLSSFGVMGTLLNPQAHPPKMFEFPKPSCELYTGKICSSVLENKTVYIPPNTTQAAIELKLTSAFSVVSHSEDLSKICEPYAVPALCYSAFAVCREDETKPAKQICQEDCQFLEHELCHREYAIAKRHPLIGRNLDLPDCDSLPGVNSFHSSDDCLSLGVPEPEPRNTGEYCYWGNGVDYRGAIGVSSSGANCLPWAEQLQFSIAEHRELLGKHNFCRNPGGKHPQPWCYVDVKGLPVVEMCNIHQCIESLWMYLTAGIVGLAVLVIALLLYYFCCKSSSDKRPNLQHESSLKGSVRSPCRKGKGSGLEMSALIPGSASSSVKSDARARVREFHPANIRFIQELGEGAFGKVYKGEIVGTGDEPMLVAIKTLKENASAKTTADFKREVDLMCELRHENIVCLLGVCLTREPLSMLFEFMPKGDLHEFLITHSPHTTEHPLNQADLLKMAVHIAAGMEYLCSHHYVHRDLAARNCLVADDMTVKISDFGLSRDVYSSDYYRVQSKSLLPVRWMPPESILYGKFTTESDVWSYGVVLWEIYSYGLQPYYGYSNQEVIEMIRSRQLLPCPEDCPSRMYSVMMECWHEVPVRRPHFPEIAARLRAFQGSQPGSVRMPVMYVPSPAHI